jgi:pectate lyase C
MSESIARTDSSSTVSMKSTRYHDIGESLFIGFGDGNVTQANNTKY